MDPTSGGASLKTVLHPSNSDPGLGYKNSELGSQEDIEGPGFYVDDYQSGAEGWNVDTIRGATKVFEDPLNSYGGRNHEQKAKAKHSVVMTPKALPKAGRRKASSTKRLSAVVARSKYKAPKPGKEREEIPINALLARNGQRLGLIKPKPGQFLEAPPCPQDAVLTINPGGRMGNKLCRYLTIWTLARRIPNALVRILPPMQEKLNLYFSGHRELETLTDKCSSAITWQHMRLGQNGSYPLRLARGESILIDGGVCPLSWFYPRREAILSELTWSPNITKEVERRLALVPRGTKTLVGVHVRRGDYGAWLQKQIRGHLVSPSYLHCALKLARKRYQRPAFLVVSDDMAWTRRHIVTNHDVLFVGSNASAAVDMATLASCDHSIVTYGTFGHMSAFLSGGDVIVPTGFSEMEYPLPEQLESAGVRVTRLPDTINC